MSFVPATFPALSAILANAGSAGAEDVSMRDAASGLVALMGPRPDANATVLSDGASVPPETPKVPETPKAPEAPKAPEVPKAPEAPVPATFVVGGKMKSIPKIPRKGGFKKTVTVAQAPGVTVVQAYPTVGSGYPVGSAYRMQDIPPPFQAGGETKTRVQVAIPISNNGKIAKVKKPRAASKDESTNALACTLRRMYIMDKTGEAAAHSDKPKEWMAVLNDALEKAKTADKKNVELRAITHALGLNKGVTSGIHTIAACVSYPTMFEVFPEEMKIVSDTFVAAKSAAGDKTVNVSGVKGPMEKRFVDLCYYNMQHNEECKLLMQKWDELKRKEEAALRAASKARQQSAKEAQQGEKAQGPKKPKTNTIANNIWHVLAAMSLPYGIDISSNMNDFAMSCYKTMWEEATKDKEGAPSLEEFLENVKDQGKKITAANKAAEEAKEATGGVQAMEGVEVMEDVEDGEEDQ